jgi:hypothetical protein
MFKLTISNLVVTTEQLDAICAAVAPVKEAIRNVRIEDQWHDTILPLSDRTGYYSNPISIEFVPATVEADLRMKALAYIKERDSK